MSTQKPDLRNTTAFEKLLYKIIIQFSLYTKGLDENLDIELVRIQEVLKTGLDQQKMQSVLKVLSAKLATLAKPNPAKTSAIPVFDYLQSCVQDKNLLKTIAQIKDRYELGEFNSQSALFAALHRLPVNVPASQDQNNSPAQLDYKDIFRNRLNRLLNSIDIPPQFNFGINILRQRTSASLTDEAYHKVIEDSIKLLLNIQKHTKTEQHDIEQFLREISNHLSSIEQHAITASNATQSSMASHAAFTSALSEHMDDIKHSSSTAKELTALQHNINNYLNDISRNLADHKRDETTRQQQTQEQLHEMTLKLQEMETEASSLRASLRVAHNQALHDPLTGLPNRLAYDERATLEIARWKRNKSPLSLVIWDIDHFKAINDNFGHKSGDRTLMLIAQLFLKNCRETDFIARFGGEEFIMLLQNTTAENALIAAEEIRIIIQDSGFNSNGQAVNMTISCGIAEFKKHDDQEKVFERADQALYQAKQEGRNRCIIAA